MRKLSFEVDLQHFQRIRKEIVPAMFTKHQYELIMKRFSNKKMSDSEKNEFSRTISRKMRAINKIAKRDKFFVNGSEKMISERIEMAKRYLEQFSRKFKGKHVFISGSFLYKEKYADIDVFVVSKYDKDDYKSGKFHFNYLTEDVYTSLFYESVRKVSVSNREILASREREKTGIDRFISIYQELFSDLDKGLGNVKTILKDFLSHAADISNVSIPDSYELSSNSDTVLASKRPKEVVKKIFVNAVLLSPDKKICLDAMRKAIKDYKDLTLEYKQHKAYYEDIKGAFEEVVDIAG